MYAGFTQILNSFVELFGIIYTTGNMLFEWLSSPIVDQAGELGSFLGEFGDLTPFELMFGSGLILILVLALAKFVMGFFG